MAKESSLFKVIGAIAVASAMTLSVATGAIIGHAVAEVDRNNTAQNGENNNTNRSIVSIDKTDTQGLIDEYTITYTDGTTSTFIVANGRDGIQGYPRISRC